MMAMLLGADSRAKAPKRIAAMRALSMLPDAVRGALKLDDEMKLLAEQLKDAQSLIFFGRGYNYSTALEAALKVRLLLVGVGWGLGLFWGWRGCSCDVWGLAS